MLELTPGQVSMGLAASDKADALRQVAQRLVADGLAADGYLAALEAREAQGSTCLGQGIAIPHGTPETRHLVHATGVRLLHFPSGVDWGDGQRVYLAIGIAAKSDEHLRLLQLLTRALGEGELGEALRGAESAEAILQLLQGAPRDLALDDPLIALGSEAEDLDELALQGARLLRRAGCVDKGFAAALLQREPLPLGDGLWWLDTHQAVERPGLAFVAPAVALQYQGQPLAGLFCLASLGDAHQALLERLCNLLVDGRGGEIVHAASSRALLETLGGDSIADWPSLRVPLANAHGLHARPAKELAQAAKAFAGEIRIRIADSGQPAVSARSLSKLLALGVRRGQVLELLAEPAIADEALPALRDAILAGLGETVEPLDAAHPEAPMDAPEVPAAEPAAPQPGEVLAAVSASPGIAIGPAHVRVARAFDYPARGQSPAQERQRLEQALAHVRGEIEALVARSEVKAIREIFVTHLEMLADPSLVEDVDARLARGESAAAAWHAVIGEAARQQEALQDALLAERAADLRDVGRRVLAQLCGVEEVAEPREPYVLVLDEMAPSDVARLDRERVAGILTARGGATSHSAIVARALGIPALVGAGARVLALAPGAMLLLDGGRGRLVVQPEAALLERARHERSERERLLREAEAHKLEPAVTRDGHAVEVCANLGDAQGAAAAVAQGAEGIGLLRTEFIFMAHAQAPDLATQAADYRRVFDALDGRPLVARTLDVGGDKPLPYWPIAPEDNPFLGLRGVRLTLQRPQVMRTQLRALLQAAEGRPLRIMFPMVGSVAEWRQARDMARELLDGLPQADVQLGIMVEVPSAALLAPVLAREVDFFSVGTNDLTQYTLAIDRGHPSLSAQADGLHPAVLQLIDMTVRAAHAHGKWVGVCGELASDPLAVPLLVGLGVDELSVSARSIAEIKARIRAMSQAAAQELAAVALQAESAEAVRELAERF